MNWRCLALPALTSLAACASPQGAYPSLAIRPAERAAGTMQPPPAEPVLTAPPATTLDRVAQLAADARADHHAFQRIVESARGTIAGARGADIGEEAWSRGVAALADVRAARAKTMVPLADLDRLFVDAGTQGEKTDRIAAARGEAAGLVDSEDRAVAELSTNIR
jgi:hypothetical protein